MKTCLLAAAGLLVSTALFAEPVSVLGRSIKLRQPEGFCSLGDSLAERALLDAQRKMMEPVGVLAQFGVPCEQREAFKAGRSESLSRWAQVLVFRRRGQLAEVSESREEFVRVTAASVSQQPVDLREAERRIAQRLSQLDMKVKPTMMQPVGVRDSAFYTYMHMHVEKDGVVVPTAAVLGITVANRLPVVVQVYGTVPNDAERLMRVAREYVKAVTSDNPE